MIIDFADFTTGGTVVNPPLEDVVLTDKEVYPYTADTIVRSVSYSRTIEVGRFYGYCLPFDIYITEDMYNSVEQYYPNPVFKYNPNNGHFLPILTDLKILPTGTLIKANSPILFRSRNGVTEYTIHGDNRKGYVELKAGTGKPNIETSKPYVINNSEGKWYFYPVQEKILSGEVGADIICYISSNGKIGWTDLPNTSINSYRWILTHDNLINYNSNN